MFIFPLENCTIHFYYSPHIAKSFKMLSVQFLWGKNGLSVLMFWVIWPGEVKVVVVWGFCFSFVFGKVVFSQVLVKWLELLLIHESATWRVLTTCTAAPCYDFSPPNFPGKNDKSLGTTLHSVTNIWYTYVHFFTHITQGFFKIYKL